MTSNEITIFADKIFQDNPKWVNSENAQTCHEFISL